MNKEIALERQEILAEKVILQIFNKEVNFEELDFEERKEFCSYVIKNKLNVKTFGKKGFNLLSNSFFAYEYIQSDRPYFTSDLIEFSSFEEYYKYILGSIYSNSCYFGYQFSNEEINKFHIELGKINFDAFIKEDISSFTYEKLKDTTIEQDNQKLQEVESLKKWFNRCKAPISYKDIDSKLDYFCNNENFHYERDVFFSLLLRKYDRQIEDVIIETFDRDNLCEQLLGEILFRYGSESALKAICNYEPGSLATTTVYGKRSRLKKRYNSFLNNEYSIQIHKGYSSEKQLYYYCKMYIQEGTFYPIFKSKEYFFDFNEFVVFLDGDLRGCDFFESPISKHQIMNYTFDETTIMPKEVNYDKFIIKKGFDGREFYVNQVWYDSQNSELLSDEQTFEYLFDYIHFLKNDISNSDLILCEGIECLSKIPNLVFKDIHVRSEIAEILGLSMNRLDESNFQIQESECINKNELATIEEYELERQCYEDEDEFIIQYVTDIHLESRIKAFKSRTVEDVTYVVRTIVSDLNNELGIKLIGGDIADDFSLYKFFIQTFALKKKGNCFITLGNHELRAFKGKRINEIVHEYRNLLSEKGLYLVHNNLYYFQGNTVEEITAEELSVISVKSLREKARAANLIIFGGIGFSGFNEFFNAENNIYNDLIDRKEEISLSESFYDLYQKVVAALYDKNVIILTHMPLIDWAGHAPHIKGFVYVSGHNHKNYCFDDGNKRIYSDNQIGYRNRKTVKFKKFEINSNYDWFSDYSDGIYEISRDDYIKYYRGIGVPIEFNREFDKLYMLKRMGIYMFLMKQNEEKLYILSGGHLRKVFVNDLSYYFEHLIEYSTSLKLFLSNYYDFQKEVSKEINVLGGSGRIHGCIIDIDFFNHIYINPIDGKMTAYNALNIVEKYVYNNLISLLSQQCPKIYENYLSMVNKNKNSKEFDLIRNSGKVSTKVKPFFDTSIYRVSNVIKCLQYTMKYNVVRLWNDKLLGESSIEKGKAIVGDLLGIPIQNKE